MSLLHTSHSHQVLLIKCPRFCSEEYAEVIAALYTYLCLGKHQGISHRRPKEVVVGPTLDSSIKFLV